MNEPIVRRDDFWGDFVNALFFRPVSRSFKPASQKTDATTTDAKMKSEENSVSQDPHAGSENTSSILITEPLPGLDPERGIKVRSANNVLTIETQAEAQTGDRDRLQFSRRIPLPPEADPDARVTSYNDGLLMIRIPLRRPVNESTATEGPGPRPIGRDLVELKARAWKAAFRPAHEGPDPKVRGMAPSTFGTSEYDLFLPAFSEIATGTVNRWLKQVGDRVEVDEPLVEVSTDKVDTEIPSPIAGVIEEILVAEDETAEVDASLVRIRTGVSSAEAAPPTTEAPQVKYDKTAPMSQVRPGEAVIQASERTGHRVPEQTVVLERFVDEMYQRYEQDKNMVDAKWWPLFESFDAGDHPSTDSVFGEAPAGHPDSGEETAPPSR